jgi:hypothetical protein
MRGYCGSVLIGVSLLLIAGSAGCQGTQQEMIQKAESDSLFGTPPVVYRPLFGSDRSRSDISTVDPGR